MSDLVLREEKYFEERGNIYTVYSGAEIPDIHFVQDKITKSHRGVIRGFHGDDKTWKLIGCLSGKIKLVTYGVDSGERSEYYLDGDSSTYTSVLVPPRTLNAHQCLTKECIFYYKWSHFYEGPERQWSVYFDDPEIDPKWDNSHPLIVSDRDKNSIHLSELRRILDEH
jgi:dTDP-4-dehydrorhamnose 3,5-epimerase